MKQAIDLVQHCTTMEDVRRNVNALDDVLVPLLVTRIGYMTQAARIKGDVSQVRDEARMASTVGPDARRASDAAILAAIKASARQVLLEDSDDSSG